MGGFLDRLFFTRENDLDLLQLAFLALLFATISTARLVALAPSASEAVQVEALDTLRWLVGLLVLTAVPKSLIPVVVVGLLTSKYGEAASLASSEIAARRDVAAGVKPAP